MKPHSSITLVVAVMACSSVLADEMSFPTIVGAEVANAPRLQQPFLVMAGTGPVLTEKHGLAAPALWDWDGDGLKDLLVGEFETNSGESFPMGADGSTIRVYRNIGTETSPKFSSEFTWARDTAGTIMEVPQWCCIGFTPYFYDLNADGHLDMVTGQYHPGEVTWFRGTGSGFLPGEILPQEGDPSVNVPSTAANRFEDMETFDYWVYSSASMGDFDDDGDYDLIVGGSSLRMSENIGGRKRPSFAQRTLLLDVHGQPLRVREQSQFELEFGDYESPPAGDGKTSPYVVDWDGDGVLDLLVTDSYRSPASKAVAFFRGVKTSDGHRFEPAVDLLRTENGEKALPGSGPRVYVDDWNGDGVNDLIIGASIATVNDGEFSDELSWEWEDTTSVESAGKDPGLYPPRERPTRESMLAMYEGSDYKPSDEELDEMVEMNIDYWEKEVGRLYRENKEHWLTMRHQGRIYVMLGTSPMQTSAVEPRETQTPTAPTTTETVVPGSASDYPVTVALEIPDSIAPGSAETVALRVDIANGWYIYAPTGRNTAQGMIETSVRFDAAEPLSLVKMNMPRLIQYKGAFDTYTGPSVRWRQEVAAEADPRAAETEVSCTVTFQTCKDDLCLPPKTETLTATLKIE